MARDLRLVYFDVPKTEGGPDARRCVRVVARVRAVGPEASWRAEEVVAGGNRIRTPFVFRESFLLAGEVLAGAHDDVEAWRLHELALETRRAERAAREASK